MDKKIKYGQKIKIWTQMKIWTKMKMWTKWKYEQSGQIEKKNIETKLDKVEQNRQKLDKIKNVDKIGR